MGTTNTVAKFIGIIKAINPVLTDDDAAKLCDMFAEMIELEVEEAVDGVDLSDAVESVVNEMDLSDAVGEVCEDAGYVTVSEVDDKLNEFDIGAAVEDAIENLDIDEYLGGDIVEITAEVVNETLGSMTLRQRVVWLFTGTLPAIKKAVR
jgi:hypothetical protein